MIISSCETFMQEFMKYKKVNEYYIFVYFLVHFGFSEHGHICCMAHYGLSEDGEIGTFHQIE